MKVAQFHRGGGSLAPWSLCFYDEWFGTAAGINLANGRQHSIAERRPGDTHDINLHTYTAPQSGGPATGITGPSGTADRSVWDSVRVTQ